MKYKINRRKTIRVIILFLLSLIFDKYTSKNYFLDDSYFSIGQFSLNKTGKDESVFQNHGELINVVFEEDFNKNEESALDFSHSDKAIVKIPNLDIYNKETISIS